MLSQVIDDLNFLLMIRNCVQFDGNQKNQLI